MNRILTGGVGVGVWMGTGLLLGLPAKKLPQCSLRGEALLKKEAALTLSLLPGWQAWDPVSGVSSCPCEDPFPRVALCPRTTSARREPGARLGQP